MTQPTTLWRRGLLGLGALALTVGLLSVHAQPVTARPISASWKGGCPSSGAYVNPWGRAYLQEYGRSGVTRFKAKFRLYRTNVGAGWNPPRLERTYTSASFPNDARNFWVWLPTNGVHQWTEVFGTNTYRLDVRTTWERPWRRDWNNQYAITYCQSLSISG